MASHSQERADRSERVPRVAEAAEVDRSAEREVARGGQARADGYAGDDEQPQQDEADDADGPAKPDDGDELFQDDGQEDAAACASAGRDPDRERAALFELMS